MKTKQIEALQIVMIEAAKLKPYSRNARTHSPEQIDLICKSMQEYGWTNPILIADGGILAGHGRLSAALALGLVKVPCLDLSHLSAVQRKAYVISDNQLALRSGWDLDLLKLELADLKLDGFDMDLLGFGDELTDLIDPDLLVPDKDPDDVPDVPEVAFSVLGDQWILGPHKLRCGDSTKMEDWAALMGGEMADVQVTDPPYNVAYESKLAGSIKNDSMSNDKFKEFLLGFYRCSFAHMKPGAALYVAHADSESVNFRTALLETGFILKSCLMWVKNALVLGRGDFHYRHEPIIYAIKPGAKRAWFGARKQTTVQQFGEGAPFEKMPDGRYAVRNGDAVLYVDAAAAVEEVPSTLLHYNKPTRSAMHPTTKPVALWERLARNNARANDIIMDAFGGSGTTLMAAERLGMCARLMEYDPRFVDVICVRYANYTGRLPVHAVSGAPFPREVVDRLTKKWEG